MGDSLRRINPDTWQGTASGYLVTVTRIRGRWIVHILHPKDFTVLCASASSLRDGANRARAWIERNGPPWFPPGESPP
jgi:hypothetical protein